MRSLRREVIPLAIVLVGWLWLAFTYGDAPARVPSHWGGDGRPDAWSDRSFLFFPPALMTGLYLLITFLPRLDRQRARAQALMAGTPFLVIRSGVLLVVLLMQVVTSFEPAPATMQILILSMIALGLVVAVYGGRAALARDEHDGDRRAAGDQDR